MVGNVDKIEQAYLFGQVGKSLYQKEGENFILSIEDEKPQRGRAGEIGLLSDVTSEYSMVYDVTEEELRKRLRNLYYAYKALSFSLNGLDPAMVNSRVSVIQTANKLCHKKDEKIKDEKIYDFVRNRLLGYPFPLRDEKKANEAIKNAIDEAVKADRVKAIYEELGKNRKTLQVFHEVWKKVVPEFFTDETERHRALRFFVDRGIVRELVTANPSIDDLKKKIEEELTEFEDIFEELPREILGKLLTALTEKFKLAIRTPQQEEIHKEVETIILNVDKEQVREEVKSTSERLGIKFKFADSSDLPPDEKARLIIYVDDDTSGESVREQASQLSRQSKTFAIWTSQKLREPSKVRFLKNLSEEKRRKKPSVCHDLTECIENLS